MSASGAQAPRAGEYRSVGSLCLRACGKTQVAGLRFVQIDEVVAIRAGNARPVSVLTAAGDVRDATAAGLIGPGVCSAPDQAACRAVLAEAEHSGITPSEAADRIAERRLRDVGSVKTVRRRCRPERAEHRRDGGDSRHGYDT